MIRDLAQLADHEFDVVIVGGGITGAFAAWDAALRGLRVALIERRDFGGATSAASSKVIHGGIRHLQKGEFSRVRESIRERAVFLRIAPHLVHKLPFLVPTYGHGMRGREILAAGMMVYELLGLGQNRGIVDQKKRISAHRVLSRREAIELEPDLPPAGLTGGVLYDECHMASSERTTLAVISAAAEAGAVVANYVEAVGFLTEGNRAGGVRARDVTNAVEAATGEKEVRFDIRARVVANITGPWAPRLNDLIGSQGGTPPERRFGLSKGVHIVTRSLTRSGALALATHQQSEAVLSRGGRHFFIIPWRKHALIGTTNVPYSGNPDEVGVTEKDIADFLVEINAGYPAASLRRGDVRFFFSGLYPLMDKEVRTHVYQGASKYEIHDHTDEGVRDLITVIGAKYTTARNLARQAIDHVFHKLGKSPPPARTASTAVHGGRIERFGEFLAEAIREDAQTLRLGPDVLEELVLGYGSEYRSVLQRAASDPESRRRVAPDRPTIGAMVQHAVREEMALRLTDVVFRRTGLGTIGDPGEAGLRACAAIMAGELGWSATRVEQELEAARAPFRTRG